MKTTELPALGVGLGWREEIAASILRHRAGIDWCEVISEHFINVPADRLDRAAELSRQLPLVPHGVDLSIGTDGPLDESYLDGLQTLLEAVDPPWYTDHLCFTRVPGYNLGQLAPLQFSDTIVDIVAAKARQLSARFRRPLLLENITYDFVVPGSHLTEAEFISLVVQEADVGLLLDVTNLFINSSNHGYDAERFLSQLPLERVVQLHIAGGHRVGDRWFDSHSYPVPDEVFALTELVLARAPVKGILLERDANFPDNFGLIIDELARARELFLRYRGQIQSYAHASAQTTGGAPSVDD